MGCWRAWTPVVAALAASAAKDPATTPLNEWPMIMAHDAASTYLTAGLAHQVNDWSKTQQDGGAAGLLDCGARMLDWRPKVKDDGTLIAHHGDIAEIDYPMTTSLDEMVAWAGAKGAAVEDLVVLGLSHCDGTDCDATVQALLATKSIYVVSYEELQAGLTVAAAYAKAKLPGGGAILAVFGWWDAHWDATVACAGFGDDAAAAARNGTRRLRGAPVNSTGFGWPYTCYSDDDSDNAFAFDRLWAYVAGVYAAGPPADGRLYTVQALWQETTSSVVVSELHGGTTIDEEKWSSLNAKVAAKIAARAWGDNARLGVVEVNNVCHDGPALLGVLRAI